MSPNKRFIHETTFDFQAAVGRIERLKDATEAELRHHNDVCAICYADMQVSSFSFSFLSAIHHNFDNFFSSKSDLLNEGNSVIERLFSALTCERKIQRLHLY